MLLSLASEISETVIPISRVFRDGEDVPAGTCVLYENGEVGYLDDTGDCDCEDVERGQCEEHSFEVRNGNLGYLVEVVLPDYYNAIEADESRRAAVDLKKEYRRSLDLIQDS